MSTSICLRIPMDDSLERAAKQYHALDGMLKGALPDFAIIEAYAFRARGRSKHMLYEAGTMLRFSLYSRHIPWFVVNPSQLKKFATGFGNAPKPDMIVAAKTLMGLETDDDNVADAALLGLVGHCVAFQQAGESPAIKMNNVQLDIVSALIPEYEEKVLRIEST